MLGTFETLQATDWIDVPLLVHIAPKTSGSVRPYILGGTTISFKVGETFKTTGAIESSVDADLFKDTDVALTIAAGCRFPWVPDRL